MRISEGGLWQPKTMISQEVRISHAFQDPWTPVFTGVTTSYEIIKDAMQLRRILDPGRKRFQIWFRCSSSEP
jgi:hypothetical protein